MEEKLTNTITSIVGGTVSRMNKHGFWWIEGLIVALVLGCWFVIFTFYMQMFLMIVLLLCALGCLVYLPYLLRKKKTAKAMLLFATIMMGVFIGCSPIVGIVSSKEIDHWMAEKRTQLWLYPRYYTEYMLQKNIFMREMKEVPEDVGYKEWMLKTTNPIAVYGIAFDRSDDVMKKNNMKIDGQDHEVFDMGNHYYMIVRWAGN